MKNYIKITFKDEGQDFLRWYINPDGVVMDCQPYHGRLFVGKKITNKDLTLNSYVKYVSNGEERTINYPIAQLEILEEKEIEKLENIYKKWMEIKGGKA